MKRKIQGHYVTSSTAGEKVRAFVPAPLPPCPPVAWSAELRGKFDQALLALGRLDSVSVLLPDTSLFLYMYIRQEAVLSSMIEGTQSSLSELLLFELDQEQLEIVRELTAGKRNRVFSYLKYLGIMSWGTELPGKEELA